MKPTCRGRFLWAASVALIFLSGACVPLSGAVTPEVEVSAQVEPQQPTSYLSRGRYFLTAHEPDLAMKAFLASMSIDGISVAAMTGAGIAAQQQGLLTTAKRFFEKAHSLAPQSVMANNNLGVVLYMLKEYYPAQGAFQTAFALSSGKSETAERNLNQAEATIAQIERLAETDQAIIQNEVLPGVSEFNFSEEDLQETELSAE